MKRKTIWQLHSWLGLLAGIPLLAIALSGSVLVFKDELNALFMPERVVAEPLAEGRKDLDTLRRIVERSLPNHEISGWVIFEDPRRTDFVYVIEHGQREWLHIRLNPYSGEVLDEPRPLDGPFLGWLLQFHYTLMGGTVGMAVCGVVAILLTALGITGLILYRRFWTNLFRMRWRTGGRILAGDLHKRIGALSAPVFLILGITGAYWNIAEVVHETEHHLEGEEHPVMRGPYYDHAISLEELRRRSRERIPGFDLTYVSFPYEPGLPFSLYGRLDGQGSLRSEYNSSVSFDARSGEYLSHTSIVEAGALRQAVDAFEPLHFGSFGGIATRLLWCVLGTAPGLLALSGAFVWWTRARRPSHRVVLRSPAVLGRRR